MNELHIPFGLDKFTGEEVEPEDALRGRACNCLCPGCRAPLLSRHPQSDERRIHFAHDSRHPDAKPVEDCPLSPFVALGMMLRRVAPKLSGQEVNLPPYQKWVGFKCCSHPGEKIQIFDGGLSTIEKCLSSPSIEGQTFDLALVINGKEYFVDLFYPGKPQKDLPKGLATRCDIGGVFSIAGSEFFEMMSKIEYRKKRYSDAVIYFLLNYSEKIWGYHWDQERLVSQSQTRHQCVWNTGSTRAASYSSYTPRYAAPYTPSAVGVDERLRKEREAAEAYRRASAGDDRPSSYFENRNSLERSPAITTPAISPAIGISGLPENTGGTNYECVFCNVKFNTQPNTPPNCPVCKSHLGARRS